MSYDLNNALAFGNFVEGAVREAEGTGPLPEINESQISHIYDELSSTDNKSTELLEVAKEETDNTDYDSITELEVDPDSPFPGVVEQVESTTTVDDFNEILDTYNLSKEEAENVLKLIDAYRNHEVRDYYSGLPQSFKEVADGFRDIAKRQGEKMSKQSAATFFLDQIIHDSAFAGAMNTLQSDLNKINLEMNKEYNKIFTDAFEDVFKNIDQIESENPEKAKQIREIKQAFEDSATYEKQLEYAKNIGANKLTKLAKRLDNEALYFNKKVNVTDVKVPDVRELVAIINNNLPEYDVEIVRKFVVILCKTLVDIDAANDIVGLAYLYKSINNIFIYKFIDSPEDNEAATLLFGNIAKVLDCIKNK